MFRLLTIAIFRLYVNPWKVVIQDLIWAVYSGDVGDEVGQDLICVMEVGGEYMGYLLLCIFELIIVTSMVSCVEHVCTLYTYPICMYCATIYKNMELVVFVVGTLTKN